ncbi:hypothetical protein NDU88_000723 [Pleurodeles waltl]|uniref:Uncharacterized protein n=1 Tax=Pleurodeles waltl TaxID=8319 RepID=A0AAV7NCS1_PLEWA|nr:hypothetical protein NDU88_000723 [Pleurodeles waltl]
MSNTAEHVRSMAPVGCWSGPGAAPQRGSSACFTAFHTTPHRLRTRRIAAEGGHGGGPDSGTIAYLTGPRGPPEMQPVGHHEVSVSCKEISYRRLTQEVRGSGAPLE